MLSDKELRAFVPTVKPDKARAFYRDTLELTLLSEDNFALEFDANGTTLRVTIVPGLIPHSFTVLGWHVPDIAATVSALNKKGVVCEKYEFLEQDKAGVWTAPGGTKVAWFKDPDGNLLSLSQ
jgi:catechol 2,3-dioxygenase-like lactoylglutathione lyase family enzyme